MLLDCFHPIRSKRYHERRYRFIRKVKANSTPSRYAAHFSPVSDVEETPAFDDAPGWIRGDEWGWVGLVTPPSLATSEKTRIDLWYKPRMTPRKSYASSVVSVASPSETQLSGSNSVFSVSTTSGPLTPSSSKRSLSLFLGGGGGKKDKDDPALTPTKPSRTLTALPPHETPTSPSPSRFKLLTRKVSGAILSLGPSSGSRSASPTPTESASTLPEKKHSIPYPASSGIVYQIPKVANADECDYPCLYNPEETAGIEVSG